MFSDLLRQDLEQAGLSAEGCGSPLEAGERWPNWETCYWIAAAFGWPRTIPKLR